jgi:hypothetical protein
MRTARLITIAIVAALAATVVIPMSAFAAGTLMKNDYGLSYAGASACIECHGANYNKTAHGEFAVNGAVPIDDLFWPATAPNGRGLTIQKSDIAFTLGASGSSATEYLIFEPSSTPVATAFKVVEGLVFEFSEGIWAPEYTSTGLFKADYNCHRCHMVGPQIAATGKTIPNPNVSVQPTAGTPWGWARMEGSDLTTLSTFVPGSSIQCESCHGTGVAADASAGGHWNVGVKVVGYGTNPYAKVASTKILDSDVCGQCHFTGSNVSGTNGTYGYSPDQRLNLFATVATAVPDQTLFETSSTYAAAQNFWPSGQNKKMNHPYYAEWNLSAHSYRGQLSASSPNASQFQKNGNGHYNPKTNTSLGCSKCHTGEGFLYRKGAAIMNGYTLTTATAGFYGQECAVCHYSHKTNGDGTGVREPDVAGVGSAAGLSTGNSSMCEDCHNWQMEIMGTPFNATSGRVSHPQREVLHGRGMPDVPAMGEFMPGAKCEQCHMPETRDGRLTHRMKIMLPGDAEKWNVPEGGDSCTPCHAGETRDQLQDNIDKWQADTQAAWDEASAALAAAQARPAAAGTDLDERAKTLISFATADGALGAHNPPYVAAGLAKAKLFARAVGANFSAFDVSDPIFVNGYGGFVAGTLVDGTGAAFVDQSVDLYSGATKLGSAKTDENGNVAFRVLPTVSTSYSLVFAVRSGNSASSGSKTIVVNKVPTSISIKGSASSVYLYKYCTISGSVSPNLAGQTVTIQRKYGTGSWVTAATRTLDGTSKYSYSWKSSKRGTWYFRAIYGGNATYAAKTSASAKVVVK